MSFQSTSDGVFSTITRHMGSQPSSARQTSSILPGKDHDSSMSYSSLWVSTQEQSRPPFRVENRKWASGPIQPLKVSPFSQNCLVRGSASKASASNLRTPKIRNNLKIWQILHQTYHALHIAYPLLCGLSLWPRTSSLALDRTPSAAMTTSARTCKSTYISTTSRYCRTNI